MLRRIKGFMAAHLDKDVTSTWIALRPQGAVCSASFATVTGPRRWRH
jgi:hypothetical protein